VQASHCDGYAEHVCTTRVSFRPSSVLIRRWSRSLRRPPIDFSPSSSLKQDQTNAIVDRPDSSWARGLRDPRRGRPTTRLLGPAPLLVALPGSCPPWSLPGSLCSVNELALQAGKSGLGVSGGELPGGPRYGEPDAATFGWFELGADRSCRTPKEAGGAGRGLYGKWSGSEGQLGIQSGLQSLFPSDAGHPEEEGVTQADGQGGIPMNGQTDRTAVLVLIGCGVVYASLEHPAFGAALLVGAGVVTLLHLLWKDQ
ncbi:hypothetical protein RKD23_008043, partial [Streptomyces sp. SAI-170]